MLDHVIIYARDSCNRMRDRAFRMYEGLKFVNDGLTISYDDCDLDNSISVVKTACSFDICYRIFIQATIATMLLKYYIFGALCFIQCLSSDQTQFPSAQENQIRLGAERTDQYIHNLTDKKVGMVVNHTSVIGTDHLVDYLIDQDIDVTAIFAPEHGFKGGADAGAEIDNGMYKSSIPLYSLYGKTKKPSDEMLAGIDVLVFDIQDVGARFYTYLSTLHYAMEAAAENGISIIVLDRPNPNGHLIDGPIMEEEFMSFVGLHPVPIVYGMTIGEYAYMINGEGWLANQIKADLSVIPCQHYQHGSYYELPIAPSPNLPNLKSILHYPSLCLFEGTTVSVGRGTTQQFQLYGHPDIIGEFSFTPISRDGAKYPKHEGVTCHGVNLSAVDVRDIRNKSQLDLSYLIDAYERLNSKNAQFFNDNNFFEKLAGTATLRNQITQGLSEVEIRSTWQADLSAFKKIRSKYLIY